VQERDKLFLPRCIVLELIQALKFKMTLPDENLILLVQVLPIMSFTYLSYLTCRIVSYHIIYSLLGLI